MFFTFVFIVGGRSYVEKCWTFFSTYLYQPFRRLSLPSITREMAQDYNSSFRFSVRKTVFMDTG